MSVTDSEEGSHNGHLSDAESIDFEDSFVRNDRENTKPFKKIPIQSYNHIAKEVSNLERSVEFYIDLLGFVEIPRPPFECEGKWMFGHGLILHIVASRFPEEKAVHTKQSQKRFLRTMSRIDHMAFVSRDIEGVKEILTENNIEFIEEFPLHEKSFQQLFFLDPDANVVEISNCGPDIGKITCDNQIC